MNDPKDSSTEESSSQDRSSQDRSLPLRSAQDAVLVRRRRMARRRTSRRLRQGIVATAIVFTAVQVLRGTPAEPAADAGAASLGVMAVSTRAANAAGVPLAEPSVLTDSPLWRRPGDVLKRDKAADAPAFAFGTDRRLHERHESLNRWHRIYSFATRYHIKPELSRRIYDAAVTAGIEPELGFRLVRVESVFDPKAESPVGALGLTQLMPSTARLFEPNVTREQLLNPDVNLRIGFRYLRGLIREYDGDLKLALLVYNRGPVAVGRALAMGKSPANGYESIVTRGYRGRGTLD